MSNSVVAPPVPEVHYLPALLRRVESGDIRIPAFQRDFVWTRGQIIELLESVYHGYPVGSLLFWRVDKAVLKIDHNDGLPFPNLPENYPLTFVLDGMQRLTSLFGVLSTSAEERQATFGVAFNLRTATFHYPDHLEDEDILLGDLFAPRRLLEVQRRLSEMEDGDLLIDRSVKLHSTFQEYLIPTVTIQGRSVQEVVEIFERINSTGTSLSSVDFMRALTWSADFDLSRRLDDLSSHMESFGFFFEDDTLVKAVAVMAGRAPVPEEMLKLRDCSVSQLEEAVGKAYAALERAVDFLRSEFHILTSHYVPYEGQLLVLAAIFAGDGHPGSEVLDEVRRWFWSVSFSEGLRGKPDNFVARSITSARRLLDGDPKALRYRLDLNPVALFERRFIRGKALSAAIACAFAHNRARSVVTGEVIDRYDYMSEFDPINFGVVLPLSSLKSLSSRYQSSRVFANILAASNVDGANQGGKPYIDLLLSMEERLGKECAEQVCNSQFFDLRALEDLREGNYSSFLQRRALLLYDFAHDVTGGYSRLG